MDWLSMSPNLNPIEHLWGIHKWKVEECKVNKATSTSSVMSSWKRVPVATCEALVNSMPKRIIAVLKSNGGYTNIDTWAQFGHFQFC